MGERRKARELALQMLFQIDFGGILLDDVVKSFLEELNENESVKDFALSLVRGALENLDSIDDLIKERLQNWEFNRIANVDKNILRLAVYELLYREDIPVAVTINEAIEIAKEYSSHESGKFINGILDKIRKDKGK
ncbi:MAG: transcription antitermination factor NusB [Candidatus Firestonebacteria bacterium]